MNHSNFRYKTTVQRLCIVLNALLLGVNAVLSIRLKGANLKLGSVELPASSLNGCIQVIMCLLCIILVLIDCKPNAYGSRTAGAGMFPEQRVGLLNIDQWNEL